MYYRGSAAAVVVYDITDEVMVMSSDDGVCIVFRVQRSFNEMQTWITELKQLGPQNIILAITGNKSDLEAKRKVRLSFSVCLGTYYVFVCVCVCLCVCVCGAAGIESNRRGLC